MTDWIADELGDGYQQLTIPLGDDPDGEGAIDATLVRRTPPARVEGAVIYVHGFSDYFFQTELADFFTDRGFAFYALDLRKCGRSRRDGHTGHYVSDLALYDQELDRALEIVRDETGDKPVVLAAHSTGGLILPLWLDRMNQTPGAVAACRDRRSDPQQPVVRPARQGMDAIGRHHGHRSSRQAQAHDSDQPAAE